MKAKLGPVSLRLFLGVALLLMSILSFGGPATSAAATGPLQNPGFEGGVNPTTGAPLYWTVVSAPDAVKVVGTEGPADFPTYADANNGDIAGDITVSPYKGDLMLRLGSPKRIAESQNTGRNTVSQTFTPSRDTLKFSFRLFSWESRGRDVFSFNLTKANRSSVGTLVPFNITMPSGTTVGCSALPCQFTIDVGKQGQFLDSGWREVEIQDVPTNVGDLTLTYTAGGTENNAHATWAYFDNVNTPPVARFSFDPSSPLEGGRIRFLDQSYDLDPDDAVVSWQWTVQGPLERGLYRKADLVSFRYLFDNSESPWVSQNPSFIAPENGTYVVKLTVTDTYGASTTVLSGAIATDGVVMSQLLVGNTPPLVNALNIEVREGDSALLIGRFLDHGFMDLHNAVWVLPGGDTVPATVQEEHRAFLTAGLVTGQIPWATLQAALGGATELQGAMLRVTEYEGGTASGEDQFTISVLPNDINDREPNNDQASAVALPSDWVYSSYLQSQGDIDVFEITRSDGSPLPAGSEVLVNLKDLPADYDLVLLTQSPGDAGSLQQAYFDMTTFDMTLFDMTLFDMTLFDMTLFDMTTFDMTLFDMTTFDMTLFDMTTFDMTLFDMTTFDMTL
ncbi:MAG: PKD domain-containing protein, partial [Chloroflexi bacterium]|nr:PKD domain-containing protein [Chloroflexota bacterium]